MTNIDSKILCGDIPRQAGCELIQQHVKETLSVAWSFNETLF